MLNSIPSHSINIKGQLLDLSKPKIMGILNITPDSFSDGGKFNNTDTALVHTENMIKKGASMIDIGAQSTRPGAEKISAEEEILRLGSIISSVKKEFPEILISLDSFYAKTLEFGYNEGVDIVNDISAGQFDSELLPKVAQYKLPYILMHGNAHYNQMHDKKIDQNIIVEINYFFSKKRKELYDMGIFDIILDPGFGFGKTIEQQYYMLENLEQIGMDLNPILIGISRKSFIYKKLQKSPLEIGEETKVLHQKALKKGAKIFRVHDVDQVF